MQALNCFRYIDKELQVARNGKVCIVYSVKTLNLGLVRVIRKVHNQMKQPTEISRRKAKTRK